MQTLEDPGKSLHKKIVAALVEYLTILLTVREPADDAPCSQGIGLKIRDALLCSIRS